MQLISHLFRKASNVRSRLRTIAGALDPYARIPRFPLNITDRLNVGEAVFKNRIDRPNYAFALWLATVEALKLGIRKLQVFEFGVAYGDGLVNICKICDLISRSTDMQFEIFGFDSDIGMPQLTGSYLDHPEIWHEGQFLSDHAAIRSRLTPNAELISGNIKDTISGFIANRMGPDRPVGFVSIDVDLYTSAVDCLALLKHDNPACYLPTTILWLDDINDLLTCNAWCGEALAVREFNEAHKLRKMQELRIRQNHPPAGWHDQIYGFHVLDHPIRQSKHAGVMLDINITAM